MRAGYSESSNTRLRNYGHAAAWTGTPPTSSPSTSPEPPRRQVLTTLRATLGDRRAAEDAVRDAFRLAALRWDMMAGCPPETKRGLLCAVAIRRAIDEYRRRKRVRPAGSPEDVAGESPGAGRAALTRVQGGTLPGGDRRMPGIRRRVAYLRFREGWTNRMIAEHLGPGPGTVTKHVSDA